MKLKFKKLDPLAVIPSRAKSGDSGLDIRSVESYTLFPMHRHSFSTGIACATEKGYDLQVRPRSGMCAKGIVAMFGTVDQGYRGEICVTLVNLSSEPYQVSVGDRIAQLVPSEVIEVESEEVDNLDSTERGECGFGSTGK